MIIAKQKRKENIAEYLIYMYQVEDLIRANNFDPLRLDQTIIQAFDAPYDVKREMLEWYKGLIHDLISEKKQKSGHLDMLNEISDRMNRLNTDILNQGTNDAFLKAYDRARPNLEALRMRSGHRSEHDVQLALNGLYGLLILKLQKTEVSEETEKAFRAISEWMALLSAEFMQQEDVR